MPILELVKADLARFARLAAGHTEMVARLGESERHDAVRLLRDLAENVALGGIDEDDCLVGSRGEELAVGMVGEGSDRWGGALKAVPATSDAAMTERALFMVIRSNGVVIAETREILSGAMLFSRRMLSEFPGAQIARSRIIRLGNSCQSG